MNFKIDFWIKFDEPSTYIVKKETPEGWVNIKQFLKFEDAAKYITELRKLSKKEGINEKC